MSTPDDDLPTDAEREAALHTVCEMRGLMVATIQKAIAANRDGGTKRDVQIIAFAALRYLTGPCAFEEPHAREIIEQVRGGADQEEIVRAILGIQ